MSFGVCDWNVLDTSMTENAVNGFMPMTYVTGGCCFSRFQHWLAGDILLERTIVDKSALSTTGTMFEVTHYEYNLLRKMHA